MKAKREQERQDARRAAEYLNSPTSSSSQRRRKKRKKKQLPKTSSHSSRGAGRVRQLCCARRRLRQLHAYNACFPCDVPLRAVFPSVVVRPEMLGFMAVMNQNTVPRSSSTMAVACAGLVLLVTMHLALCSLLASPGCSASWPVCTRRTVTTWCPWSKMLKTVESPQLQSIQVADISFVAQRQFLMVQTVRRTIFFSSEHGGRCPCCGGPADSQVLLWRRHSCSHSCSSLRKSSCRFCQGAEAVSHGPGWFADHGTSPVAVH